MHPIRKPFTDTELAAKARRTLETIDPDRQWFMSEGLDYNVTYRLIAEW